MPFFPNILNDHFHMVSCMDISILSYPLSGSNTGLKAKGSELQRLHNLF